MRSAERRLLAALLMAASLAWPGAASAQRERVDLALVLAVDVSDSVDAERYALQMNGIARAFEDPLVQSAMLSGPHRAMLVTLITWSSRATVALPWTLLTGSDDIGRFAAEVGAEVIYHGDGDTPLVAEAGQAWDAVLLVRYPSRRAFSEMVRNPAYQEGTHLRDEALVEAVLQPTVPHAPRAT